MEEKNKGKKVLEELSFRQQMEGFITFVREQGIVGLAVGFILGGSVSKVVSSLVNDIVMPLIGVVIGSKEGLQMAEFTIGTVQIRYGSFLSVLLDFIVVAIIVYYGIKGLGLEKIDKKKG